MRFIKYIIPFWAALLFYAIASFIAGDVGVRAYDELKTEYDKQLKNFEKLQNINAALSAERDALQSDSDEIAMRARELGFGREGERFMKISGWQGRQARLMESGEIYRAVEPELVDDKTLRIIAAAIFVFLFLSIFVADVLMFVRSV